MTEKNTLIDVIRAFVKWKKIILTITLVAAVGSIIVSFLLPVYYKSTAIFYPYSVEGLDPKNILSEEKADVFGTNNDLERLRQMGLSSQLIGHMVKKFDLYNRYDIDQTDKLAGYKVSEEYKDNYTISKNENDALEVSILDTDPNTAAQMANEVVRFIDSLNRQSLLNNNSTLYASLKASLDEKYKELSEVRGSVEGNKNNEEKKSASISPQTLLQTGEINEFNSRLMDKITEAIELKEKYAQIHALLNSNFTTIFIIEHATPAVKKSKPIRFVIVLASTFLAFFLVLIGVLIAEFYKNNIKVLLNDARGGN